MHISTPAVCTVWAWLEQSYLAILQSACVNKQQQKRLFTFWSAWCDLCTVAHGAKLLTLDKVSSAAHKELGSSPPQLYVSRNELFGRKWGRSVSESLFVCNTGVLEIDFFHHSLAPVLHNVFGSIWNSECFVHISFGQFAVLNPTDWGLGWVFTNVKLWPIAEIVYCCWMGCLLRRLC